MSVLSKLPAVLGKLTELAGAGLASAAGAFLFAQLAKPVAPPPPIVQIEPVQEELVRAVRSENAALIQELRKAETARETVTETSPRIASVAAPKPAKPGQTPASGRKPNADHGGMGVTDRKSDRVNEADMRAPDMRAPDMRAPDAKAPDITAPMNGRAQPTAAASLVPVSASNPAPQVVDSTSAIDQSPARGAEFPWLARLRQIPDIFRPAPSAARTAPRPPMPVGELVSGEM
jgi:hypothetical protein